jgi:hypothetical protein
MVRDGHQGDDGGDWETDEEVDVEACEVKNYQLSDEDILKSVGL